MTVIELTEKLKELPENYTVYISRTTDDYFYETKEIFSIDKFGGIVVID